MPADPTRLTLPQVAARLGASLDSLRRRVRESEELQAMFVRVGPLRALPADRLGAFAAAVGKPLAPAAAEGSV